jgi:hypothetical protein
MALTLAQEQRFQDAVDQIMPERDRLSPWEQGFYFGDGTEDRPGLITQFVEQGAAAIFISPKMWAIIERTIKKVNPQ